MTTKTKNGPTRERGAATTSRLDVSPSRYQQRDDPASVSANRTPVRDEELRPTALPVRRAGIPASLQAIDRWVLWRHDRDPIGNKWDKVPYSPATGRRTNGTQIRFGHAFGDCWRAYKAGGWDGVGFILGEGIAGVDQDKVLDENGALILRSEVASAFAGTYREVSPSGTGWKGFLNLDTERIGHVGRNARNGEELYAGKRWFAVTGHRMGDTKLVTDQTDAFEAMAQRIGARIGTQRDAIAAEPADPGKHFLRFHLPYSLAQGVEWLSVLDPDDPEPVWFNQRMQPWQLQYGEAGFEAFDDWSSTSWRYGGTESLRAKWDYAARRNAALPEQARPQDVCTMGTIKRDAEEIMGGTTNAPTAAEIGVDYETGRERMERFKIIEERPILGALLPVGVSVFAGDGGAGKSTILATAAAHVSNGASLPPWEPRNATPRKPGRVLWLTVEEDVDRIVLPRHHRLGGDLDRIVVPVLQRTKTDDGEWTASSFDIEKHLPELLTKAETRKEHIDMVVADSLPGLVQWQGRSTTSDTDVKRLLSNLREVSTFFGCAIAGIAHWNKKVDLGEEYRMSGAQAWRTSPRLSWTVDKGFIYTNKSNDMPEVGCAFHQEIVAVLYEIPVEMADGKPLQVAARRAAFGELMLKEQVLAAKKGASETTGEVELPRKDRLINAARDYFECFGDAVDAGDLWSYVEKRCSISQIKSTEKDEIRTRLGLTSKRAGSRHLLSIVPIDEIASG